MITTSKNRSNTCWIITVLVSSEFVVMNLQSRVKRIASMSATCNIMLRWCFHSFFQRDEYSLLKENDILWISRFSLDKPWVSETTGARCRYTIHESLMAYENGCSDIKTTRNWTRNNCFFIAFWRILAEQNGKGTAMSKGCKRTRHHATDSKKIIFSFQ